MAEASGVAGGAASGAAAGSVFGPIGTIAGGVLGALGGIAGGGAPAAPNVFGATNTTFGSVNFKSAGAGDRGKTTGTTDAAAQGVTSTAVASTWLIPLVIVVGVVAVVFLLIPKRKKKS